MHQMCILKIAVSSLFDSKILKIEVSKLIKRWRADRNIKGPKLAIENQPTSQDKTTLTVAKIKTHIETKSVNEKLKDISESFVIVKTLRCQFIDT